MRPFAPLVPDGDEARRWAEQELSDPVYRTAEPTAFDRAARAVAEFIGNLFSGDLSALSGPWLTIAIALVVAALAVAAVLVWGLPRFAARSRGRAALFDADDTLTAAELRRDAEATAARGEWDAATVLRTRAIARALAERTVLEVEPGATVHRFARAATAAFPREREALDLLADDFDDVRYLHRRGTADAYERARALDERLQRTTPLLDEADAVGAGARS